MVGHLNYGAISNQPAVADLVEELWKGLSSSGVFQRIKTETGIEPKDLMDQVYVGMNFPIGAQTAGAQTAKPVITLLMHSRVPFDQVKMRTAFKDASPERHKWQTYFKVTDVEAYNLAYMPSNQYLLFTNAPESTLQALIEANHSQPGLSPDMVSLVQSLDKEEGWFVVNIDEKVRKDLQSQPMAPGVNMSAGLQNGIRKARAFGLSARLDGSKVKFQATVNCGDDGSAKQMAEAVSHMYDQSKTALNLLVMTSPKNQSALIKEAMQSLSFGSQGMLAHAGVQVGFSELKSMVMETMSAMARPQAGPMGPRGAPGGPGAPGGRRGGARGGRGGP
jgi:hypothetical protein